MPCYPVPSTRRNAFHPESAESHTRANDATTSIKAPDLIGVEEAYAATSAGFWPVAKANANSTAVWDDDRRNGSIHS